MPQILSIQYLRAIAAILVVALHSSIVVRRDYAADFPMFTSGEFGVDIFFVISGFIMWTIAAAQQPTPAEFLERRIIRIVPLYWALTIPTAIISTDGGVHIDPAADFAADESCTATVYAAHVKRISKSIQRSPRPEESISAAEPVEFPVSQTQVQAESEVSIHPVPDQSSSQYLKQFDDLLALEDSAAKAETAGDLSVLSEGMVDIEKENIVDEVSAIPEGEIAEKIEVQEPQSQPMPDAAVKAAFQAKAPETAAVDLSEVRAKALQDQREIFEEPPAESGKSISGRLDEMENTLRPYRRFIGFGLIVFGVVMGTAALLLFYNIFRPFFSPKPEPAPNLPFPSEISLPGGWASNLSTGSVENGKWNPSGAEWLEGTEITRWVALPWSLQLEAVVRTLKPKDIIEVKMSNNDRLKYKVYAIREMKVDDIQTLDSGEASLLLILAKEDSDTRWVVVAIP